MGGGKESVQVAFCPSFCKDDRMPLSDSLISQRLTGCSSPAGILGESGLLRQLTKRFAESTLAAEM
jgi:hypothetical protein